MGDQLSTSRAGPDLLATLVRQHWGVESLHWLRDTVYRDDNSAATCDPNPGVMAALRNLAIGALRLTGRRDITELTRWADRAMLHTAPSRSSYAHDDLETTVSRPVTMEGTERSIQQERRSHCRVRCAAADRCPRQRVIPGGPRCAVRSRVVSRAAVPRPRLPTPGRRRYHGEGRRQGGRTATLTQAESGAGRKADRNRVAGT